MFQYRSERAKLIGYVPQGTPLIEELTAFDNLLLWKDMIQGLYYQDWLYLQLSA